MNKYTGENGVPTVFVPYKLGLGDNGMHVLGQLQSIALSSSRKILRGKPRGNIVPQERSIAC